MMRDRGPNGWRFLLNFFLANRVKLSFEFFENNLDKCFNFMVTKIISIDMKKSVVISILLSLIVIAPMDAQVGKFLKNVSSSVKQDLLGGDKNTNKPGPEPPCACDPAEFIVDLSKYKMDYTELNISVLSDGRVLIQDKLSSSYYVVKGTSTEGPIKYDDPRVKQFENVVASGDEKKGMELMYKDYISKKNDKYTISFGGKTYGQYGMITQFAVSRSKDKFAAMVTENVVVTEAEGEAMDKAVKNAKTEQEKMELSMKYAQEMQNRMMSGGGPASMTPKIVSNASTGSPDFLTIAGGILNANIKYDDIMLVAQNKILDLQGKTIFTFPVGQIPPDFFLSSDNSMSATYSYGALTITDGRKLTELFNPQLLKAEGKIFLAYMYYSPKRNAIMQCKIPF
jgi:hypothetical protein